MYDDKVYCNICKVLHTIIIFLIDTSKYAKAWNYFKVEFRKSRYLDAYCNWYFEQMVSQMYPIELTLYRANAFDTHTPFIIWTCP